MYCYNHWAGNLEKNQMIFSCSNFKRLTVTLMYMYIGSLCINFSIYSASYVEVECDICCDRRKKQRDYTFILTRLFRDCLFTIKSPDEWAIKKQAFRDESTVSLFFPYRNIYIHTHIYIFFVVVVAWDLYLAGLKRIL